LAPTVVLTTPLSGEMKPVRDAEGHKVYYYCPHCGDELEGCPDPCCVGIAHHVDWTSDVDIPWEDAIKTGRDSFPQFLKSWFRGHQPV
tara:strand:+ start:43 stop:306 length:264 start_codon:yes stop_codon:yes gene_type:complete